MNKPMFTKSFTISIHALREEGDKSLRQRHKTIQYFYPRPPRGGRHRFSGLDALAQPISIHALREEGDALDPENWIKQ